MSNEINWTKYLKGAGSMLTDYSNGTGVATKLGGLGATAPTISGFDSGGYMSS